MNIRWSETHHSQPIFIDKIETWLQQVLMLSC
jgi:hypothetical protein